MYKHFYIAKRYKWHITPLKDFKEMLELRRKNQYDNIILVTGGRGIGKSTFAGKILFQFEDFNPFEQIVYNKENLFKLAKKKNGYIWADEAVVNASKGQVMSRANKMLHELFTISRNNFNIIFLLLPFIEDFDSKILQYCSAWVHIEKRSLGVLLLPANQGIFGRANWDIINMRKIYDEFVKENKGGTHVPFYIFQNFRGYIKFGKLTIKQQEIVDQIKTARKFENLDKETQEQTIMQVKDVEQVAKYSAKQLAEFLIKGQIRSWTAFENQCKEYKLDPNEMMVKCDSILKHNNIGKSVKGLLREMEKQDSKIF